METIKIGVKNAIKTIYCIDTADGEKIYLLLRNTLSEDKLVRLSFEGIELVIAAFLNTAVGQLFKDFDAPYVESHLSVEDLHEDFQHIWNKVIKRSPNYYTHQEAMDQCISNIIEE